MDEASGAGEKHIWGDGGDEDQIDLIGGDAGIFEGGDGGFGGEIAGIFAFGGDATFFDTGSGSDPIVAGFDEFFEVGVIENAFGKIAAGADDGDGPPWLKHFCAGSRLVHEKGWR